MTHSTGVADDRRSRKRAARAEHLLELAFDLLEEGGIAAVTMTALAEAADYAPASLYTYFSSRSALLAAMQRRALAVLHEATAAAAERWQAALAELPSPPTPAAAALAPLFGFSDLFLAAPGPTRGSSCSSSSSSSPPTPRRRSTPPPSCPRR